MRNATQGLLVVVGLLLIFGGVGYMELGGNCLVGTLESLIGLGMWFLAGEMEPASQPYRYQPYSNPQNINRLV